MIENYLRNISETHYKKKGYGRGSKSGYVQVKIEKDMLEVLKQITNEEQSSNTVRQCLTHYLQIESKRNSQAV